MSLVLLKHNASEGSVGCRPTRWPHGTPQQKDAGQCKRPQMGQELRGCCNGSCCSRCRPQQRRPALRPSSGIASSSRPIPLLRRGHRNGADAERVRNRLPVREQINSSLKTNVCAPKQRVQRQRHTKGGQGGRLSSIVLSLDFVFARDISSTRSQELSRWVG